MAPDSTIYSPIDNFNQTETMWGSKFKSNMITPKVNSPVELNFSPSSKRSCCLIKNNDLKC